MLIVLFGAGCNPSHQPEQNRESSSVRDQQLTERKSDSHIIEEEAKLPLELNEGVFQTVADWKDADTIFYITNEAEGSVVHTYNLITGESSLFFESEAPIVQFEANAEQNLFLVHTSPTSYEAELVILDSKANRTFSTRIESYELEYTWDQNNPAQLFISSFIEDWSFQTYIINVMEETITNNQIEMPFIQWLNNDELSYLKWDQDAPSLTAPLYIYNYENDQETLLANHVVSNTNFMNEISTIELVDESGAASVKFYDPIDKKLLTETSTHLVAQYSDWAIPFHDMNDKKSIFYMFEGNQAQTAFSLISFDLETQEKKTLIETIENLPFKLSPNGAFALYGARFENLIRLEDNTIMQLINLK
jgi:hypothetical protein